MFGWFKKKKKQEEVKKETVVKKETPKVDEPKKEVKEAPKKEVQEEPKAAPQEEKPKAPKKRNAAMHITKHKDGGWQVKKEGAQRALRKFDTQKEAIEYAKQIEKEKGTGYIIHKANGAVRKKDYS